MIAGEKMKRKLQIVLNLYLKPGGDDTARG